MGPIAREDLYDKLGEQLKKMPTSWKVVWKSNGYKPLFPITVIEASPKEPFDEELFGPIFPLFKADSEQHAIELANATAYGLSASVYSSSRGEEVINQINSGMGFVNATAKSQANYPTGGIKRSGFGRESGVDGLRNFANVKTVYIN